MSLRRLKVDRIDLYQLHRIDEKVSLEDQIGELVALQNEGKIRHLGLSEVSVDQIKEVQKLATIVSVQNLYNISNRQSEAVLDYCEQSGLGFIPWFPIASGALSKPGGVLHSVADAHKATPAQIALAWLLKRSPVVLPIPGTGSVEHLIENTEAAQVELTDREFQEAGEWAKNASK
jgi:aryl-alcohol dehydrogenase-like predicted oxidoreductase